VVTTAAREPAGGVTGMAGAFATAGTRARRGARSDTRTRERPIVGCIDVGCIDE
jgi:hypothetical protein